MVGWRYGAPGYTFPQTADTEEITCPKSLVSWQSQHGLCTRAVSSVSRGSAEEVFGQNRLW